MSIRRPYLVAAGVDKATPVEVHDPKVLRHYGRISTAFTGALRDIEDPAARRKFAALVRNHAINAIDEMDLGRFGGEWAS